MMRKPPRCSLIFSIPDFPAKCKKLIIPALSLKIKFFGYQNCPARNPLASTDKICYTIFTREQTMQFIKHFLEIMDEDLGHVGGKGLNLGKLTRAGFAVPNGFCVTTDAYRFSVKEVSKITKEIALAPALITAIQDAHAQLKTDTAAVRSSATAEDLGDASFAGQQDTFLNVTSDTLLAAVTACWASLWASRAIAYRQTQGISNEGLAMAVVVQEMCPAEISGVLFTVSPFDENVCIIESNWGLG
ncbi:hypothetical protein C6495_06930, partial [Candidatus Poribacteria bacterium]